MTEEDEIEVDKIIFFHRGPWFKKKNICPSCRGTGEVGGQFTGGKWFKCDRCNGDGKYHEQK